MWMFNKHNLSIAKFAVDAVHFFKDKTVATDSIMIFEVSNPPNTTPEHFPTIEGHPNTPPNVVIGLNAKDVTKLKFPTVSKENKRDFPDILNAILSNNDDKYCELLATNTEDVNVALCRVSNVAPPQYTELFSDGRDVIGEVFINAERLGKILIAASKITDRGVTIKIRKPGAPIEVHGENTQTKQKFRAILGILR